MKNKIIVIVITLLLIIIALLSLIIVNNNKNDNTDKPNEPNTPEVKEEKVTITFDTDGGNTLDPVKIKKGTTYKLQGTTKEGYTFKGWFIDDKEITDDYKFDKDTTLKAKWEKIKEEVKTFSVIFDSKGGSAVNKLTVECNKTLPKLPSSTRNGYIFRGWYDKNDVPIGEGALLTCEDITLYAHWEKKEVEKKYSCPSGYTLNGTKCSIEGTVHEKCPSDTKVDGSLCIKTSDNNVGERKCRETTITIDGKGHTWTGTGDYYLQGFGHCAYYKWTNITNQADCTQNINRKAVWVSALNGCYAEVKNNNYDTVCASDYQYYSSEELTSKFGIHDNGKCLKKVDKTKYCDAEYTLTNNKCIKTIDATLS